MMHFAISQLMSTSFFIYLIIFFYFSGESNTCSFFCEPSWDRALVCTVVGDISGIKRTPTDLKPIDKIQIHASRFLV